MRGESDIPTRSMERRGIEVRRDFSVCFSFAEKSGPYRENAFLRFPLLVFLLTFRYVTLQYSRVAPSVGLPARSLGRQP